MTFLDSLEQGTNKNARTANGAVSNDSTLDYVLDFFSQAGAMRGREEQALTLFNRAYAQDKNLALKTLFYLRDIRGGQGERALFKYIFERLDSETKAKLAIHIPEYGRWDEVPLDADNIHLIKSQIESDLIALDEGGSVSLLAKWLPSEVSVSRKNRREFEKLMKLMEMKPSQYRKMLSKLRERIGLLEQDMSSKNWSEIDYSKIPSQAHKKHVKAFLRNDETRYREFLSSVEKGEATVNSGTLYTYDIYDMINGYSVSADEKRTAEALWKNLPDYTQGKNALVVADVSGSMIGRPMSVSVSLAIYFAERNKGMFKDYFMTFSDDSKLQRIVGSTLQDKINTLHRAEWGMSTNLQSAFDAILRAAKDSNASSDEMPSTLYIISDMQFNCVRDADDTNFEAARKKFNEAGYELPTIVFWNVNAYGDAPGTKFDKNVTMISGFSQSTFQYAVEGKSPVESMTDILNSERYARISV